MPAAGSELSLTASSVLAGELALSLKPKSASVRVWAASSADAMVLSAPLGARFTVPPLFKVKVVSVNLTNSMFTSVSTSPVAMVVTVNVVPLWKATS